MNSSTFYSAIAEELIRNITNYFGADNWDSRRFGRHTRPWEMAILERINAIFRGRFAFLPKRTIYAAVVEEFLRHYGTGLAKSYDLLADGYSRNIFIKVLAYRILGYRKVKLPLNNHENSESRQQIKTLIKGNKKVPVKVINWTLSYFELNEIGYPIKLYFTENGVFTIFKLKHYEYLKSKRVIKAEPGDFVIDGGGCWGDTALYFANEVGESGKVFTFEFIQNNLDILSLNLQLNSYLANRVQIVTNALWDKSDVKLSFIESGPGSVVDQNKSGSGEQVYAISIDDFVERNQVGYVDFIKMDIEGAEFPALRGAEQTIRRYRPKMAISLYHGIDDFIQIPAYLSSLNLGYSYYIDHFTMHSEETVLFAAPIPNDK